MPGAQDNGTARPATKRVRSDQDHSKAETKSREKRRQNSHNDDNDKKDEEANDEGEDGEDIDEDWLNKAPFQQDRSWDDWETVWRQSCWCGKGESASSEDAISEDRQAGDVDG